MGACLTTADLCAAVTDSNHQIFKCPSPVDDEPDELIVPNIPTTLRSFKCDCYTGFWLNHGDYYRVVCRVSIVGVNSNLLLIRFSEDILKFLVVHIYVRPIDRAHYLNTCDIRQAFSHFWLPAALGLSSA